MIDFVKTHKMESIITFIVLVIIIFIIVFAKIFFFADSGSPYGNRLDGIEKHRINEDKLRKIETDLEKKEDIDNIDIFITGKIINIMITLKSEVDYDLAKSYGEEAVLNFNKDEQSFYDVQIYLTTKEENKTYPKIGYKSKSAKKISWMK